MSLVINHNMMAMNTARNLNNTYSRLNDSVQRLSSGLRINSAADDAAGLAIRELMRADISTMQQGVRNAADAISMIQTADGGMAVIDEKLTRMKELAEQAATGTYTTLQREIINSEYQAMAAEIDRIATATNFNGVKLLDGSITNLHGGLGMKIHFGVGNKADEDYYFINTGDVRATSSSGLRIGGDAKNDIWGQGAAGSKGLAGPGCCTAGYDSLEGNAGFVSGQTFAYGYNWDWMEDDDEDLLSGKYLAGRYTVGSSWSLQDLVDEVNRGTQSRVGVQIDASALASAINNGGTAAICVGEEAYVFGSSGVAGGKYYIPATEGGEGYKAKGSYTGGVMYKAGSFVLTEEQANDLLDANVDLAALGFVAASVTSSGSAIGTSPEAALDNLLNNVANAWNALRLGRLSGLTVDKGVDNGFNLGAPTVTQNSAGVLNPNTTIISGQTLIINTGIYTDGNGNWTSSLAIASALNLKEAIYHISNPNSMQWTASCAYTSDWTVFPYATSAFAVSAAGKTNLGTYGIVISEGAISFTVTEDSTISEELAKNNLLIEAQSELVNRLGNPNELVWARNNGSGLTGYTTDQFIAASDADDTVNVTSETDAGLINDAQTLTVNTGVYIDQYGNFTYDSDVAAALNFNQLVYTFTGDTGNDLTIGVSVPGVSTGFSTLDSDTTTLGTLASGLKSAIDSVIDQLHSTANRTGVKVTKGQALEKTYLLKDLSDLNPTVTTSSVGPTQNLVASVFLNGATIGTVIPTDNMGTGYFQDFDTTKQAADIVAALNEHLQNTLGTLQADPDAGRITRAAGTVPPAPSSVNDLTVAAGSPYAYTIPSTTEQTVSTKGIIDSTKYAHMVATSATPEYDLSGRSNFGAWALASAINHNERSEFWAMYEVVNVNDTSVEMVYIFTKKGGDFNHLLACDVADGDIASQAALQAIQFENLETGTRTQDGTSFSLGGQNWGTFKPVQTKAGYGNEVWNLTLHGRDVGRDRDLWIAAVSGGENELTTPGLNADIINGLDRHSFVEIQNAADGEWAGAEVRTQSSAQEALTALNDAMERKDKVRADIGALQNRLENTMTNLEIQIEALQASESRISDVDVATEMTEFVRNQVLAQAAVSMLSQANSLPQMALSLLNG
ncbi:MAG: hypothetical protein LBJ61_05780 [Deltaproteobacteria bacterium]|jgi:flagellin-like hook-associated protein FlgL|nr:hypothetical protein [Deltaproteobacteria bacterium]